MPVLCQAVSHLFSAHCTHHLISSTFYRLPARCITVNGCTRIPCWDRSPALTPGAALPYTTVRQPSRAPKMYVGCPRRFYALGRLSRARTPACTLDCAAPRPLHLPSAPTALCRLQPPAIHLYVRGTSTVDSTILIACPDKEYVATYAFFRSPFPPVATSIGCAATTKRTH